MPNTTPAHPEPWGGDGETRRDFLLQMTVAAGAVGAAMMVWPLIDSMNPAADTLALSTTEFSISGIQEGSGITILWRGHPVFAAPEIAVEMLALPEDGKASDVVHKHVPRTLYVDVDDPGILTDIDDREGYRKLLETLA